jgi:hypothetical protein
MQNLAKGASAGMPAMPSLSGWVAPTVSVEELDKRITELKAVQFWLEQNARALTATVQALEVQRMTLSTLQGMNVAMGDIADAFGKGAQAFAAQAPAAEPAPPQAAPAAAAGEAAAAAPESAEPQREAPAAPPMVDPVQWWSALTSQFQQIAAKAMQEAPPQAAFEATRDMASGAFKTATDMAAKLATQGMPGAPKAAAAKQPAAKRKAPAKKAAPRAASPRAKRSG